VTREVRSGRCARRAAPPAASAAIGRRGQGPKWRRRPRPGCRLQTV